jgi:hypothetical protein
MPPFQINPKLLDPDHADSVTLKLMGVTAVRVRVTDDQNRPLSGARVNPVDILLPGKEKTLNTRWTSATTDSEGIAVVEFPRGAIPLRVSAEKDRYFAVHWLADLGNQAEIGIQLLPMLPLRGVVVDAHKRPVGGAIVLVAGSGLGFEDVRTNTAGEFERYVHTDKSYALVAAKERDFSPVTVCVVRAGKIVDKITLTLEPGTRVRGTFTNDKKKPVANSGFAFTVDYATEYAKRANQLPDYARSPPPLFRGPSREAETDANGQFEFYAGPGRYSIWGTGVGPDDFQFVLSGQKELTLSLVGRRQGVLPFSGKVIAPKDHEGKLTKTIIRALDFRSGSQYFGASCRADGTFTTHGLPSDKVVTACTFDRALGGMAEISADDDSVDISLALTATLRGRLVDSLSGKPLADRELVCRFEVEREGKVSKFLDANVTTLTDAAGSFVLRGFIVGRKYYVTVGGKNHLPLVPGTNQAATD